MKHKFRVMHPKPSTFMTSLQMVTPHRMHEGAVPKPRLPYCMKLCTWALAKVAEYSTLQNTGIASDGLAWCIALPVTLPPPGATFSEIHEIHFVLKNKKNAER